MTCHLFRIVLPIAALMAAGQPSLAARRPVHTRAFERGNLVGAKSFDGRWSVEVITEKGDCDKAYRWSVGIRGDRIADVGDQVAHASGSVDRSGRVRARFTHGADILTASGSLSGKWGQGVWNAPSRACSGRWVAERRG